MDCHFFIIDFFVRFDSGFNVILMFETVQLKTVHSHFFLSKKQKALALRTAHGILIITFTFVTFWVFFLSVFYNYN